MGYVLGNFVVSLNHGKVTIGFDTLFLLFPRLQYYNMCVNNIIKAQFWWRRFLLGSSFKLCEIPSFILEFQKVTIMKLYNLFVSVRWK